MLQPMEVESVKEERRDEQRINRVASLTTIPSGSPPNGNAAVSSEANRVSSSGPSGSCCISGTAVDSSTQLSITKCD